MTEPSAPPRLRRLPVLLAAAAVVPAVMMPLVPPEYRLWNFAAFGAVALFVGARGGRFGLPAAILLVLGAKFCSDLLNYRHYGYDAEYLPSPVVYSGFLGYALIGWASRQSSSKPWVIGLAALAGSGCFFLWTNLFGWIGMALPYDRNLIGLLQSYEMALPFFRGTLFSDLAFTVLLFGAEAVLVRAPQPATSAIEVSVNEEIRR